MKTIIYILLFLVVLMGSLALKASADATCNKIMMRDCGQKENEPVVKEIPSLLPSLFFF